MKNAAVIFVVTFLLHLISPASAYPQSRPVDERRPPYPMNFFHDEAPSRHAALWDDLRYEMLDNHRNHTRQSSRLYDGLQKPVHTLSDSVQVAWVSYYSSVLAPSDNFTEAIIIDNSGNVYVTGSSYSWSTASDYATIKYNSEGVEQWRVRYDGPFGLYDQATAIAVDNFGNVYVTGGSWDAESYYDYVTVKYNSDGIEEWFARYNGPGNDRDYGTAIVVDDSGNVYVTGDSYSLGSEYDYATIKYNSSGVEKWVTTYSGPSDSSDYANSIKVDSIGNVYVTGSSFGPGTDGDYTTVKYTTDGVEEWVARYNGSANDWDFATDLAIDDSGNAYVTGISYDTDTGGDFVTIKYNLDGVEQWIGRYNRLGNYNDLGYAIAVDRYGNVYVTGSSGGSDDDYTTIKYNGEGIEQWVATYDGVGSDDDRAYDVAVDGLGNVYVTGRSYGSDTGLDYATVKYNQEGVMQWVIEYDGAGEKWDIDLANGLDVDSSGNVYVTGWSENASGWFDFATLKYNSNGVEQWLKKYNEPGNSWDNPKALAIDDSGNTYVTGSSFSSETENDYATIMYDSEGTLQWVSRFTGSANGDDEAVDLTVDNMGNVYVTGSSYANDTGTDYATVRYNSDGTEQWVLRYNGFGNGPDHAKAITIDDSGNIYVTGMSMGLSIEEDYATVKYSSEGVEQWVARYNGPINGSDEAVAIVEDNLGNVYVTGRSEGSGTWYDYVTIKYSSVGSEVWISRFDGGGEFL